MVAVSSADRVVYPETGTTKGEVVAYYSHVGERMLPHVANRPLTLQRFPKGVAGKGFMQKNAADYFPAFIGRHEIDRADDGSTNHPVITTVEGLEYLANQNTITFHVPTSTIADPDHPDRFIIDLDPPEDSTAIVREAAWATKSLCDELHIATVPVATGSKGYHVIAMLDRTATVAAVDEFGQLMAALLAHRHPDTLTTEFRKANRKGRVFCDWLRNRWGSTSVAPWSLRPRSRPSVAVPIDWDLLDTVEPSHYEIDSVPAADTLLELSPSDLGAALATLRDAVAAAGVTIEPFDRFRS